MAAVSYGHVAIVPKGTWNAETQYEICHLVEYNGSSYVAKAQPPIGTLPTDISYWQVSAAGTKKATFDSLGTVMPDGATTEVNEEGKLTVKTAQQEAVGVVKGSDDITVGEDGNLTVNTAFEQATELANIIAGEAIKSVLGKVSKSIATTMNLDQNALLKNMISGIDVNSGEKIPSSAFVHTLYERLGMGTDLSAGDAENVTQAVNSLYSNLIRNEVVSTTGVYLTRSGNVRLVKFISALANSDGLIVTMSNDKPNRRTFALVESMDVSGGSPVISRVDIRTDGAIYLTDLAGNALNKVALGEIVYVIA